MKIWLINQYNMPPEYGHLNRHYYFGKHLKIMGHSPSVFVGSYLHNTKIQIVKDKKKSKTYNNVDYPFYFIKTREYSSGKIKRILSMFDFYRNIFKVSKKLEKPDVIIGSSAHPLAAIAAIRLAKKYRCQSIVEIRDLWPESFVAYGLMRKRNPLLKILYAGEKLIYKKADKLIFTMEGGKEYIIKKGWDTGNGGPINLDKIFHINNGVDLDLFKHNLDNYKVDDNDLNSNSFKIIYTGSLRQTNDSLWTLIKTAQILQDEKLNVKIIIYGEGAEKDAFLSYCNKYSLNNIFFKGYVDKKYIPHILSFSDLNILNCSSWSVLEYGGSQNKLFDYLASGKPIISGEDSKYSIVNKYGCGLSRTISGPKDLYDIILIMMNLNQEEKEQMSKKVISTSKIYSYENLTKKLIETIRGENIGENSEE